MTQDDEPNGCSLAFAALMMAAALALSWGLLGEAMARVERGQGWSQPAQ